MAKPAPSRPPALNAPVASGYWYVTRRPLQMLAFLLPLIIGYEIALAFVLRVHDQVWTNIAHKALLQFFDLFGLSPSGGLLMGGIVIVVVLLVWHLLNRDPWRIDFSALGFMALEGAALALPLIALERVLATAFTPAVAAGSLNIATTASALAQTTAADDAPWQHSLVSGIAISIGAGLYEELAFRMMLIAAMHTLLVDLGKMRHATGAAIAVVIAAAAFAGYHMLGASAGSMSTVRLTFYFVAGLYFGVIYVARGFGIVVAVHALYDIVMVAAMTESN